jgi:diguanylate cyclase (GGDEF)-like protein
MPRKPTYGELWDRICTLEEIVWQHQQVCNMLRQCEEKYRRLINNAPLGILTMGQEGRILGINPKTLGIFDSPSEAVARSINALEFPLVLPSGIPSDILRYLETVEVLAAYHPCGSRWDQPAHQHHHLTSNVDASGAITDAKAIYEDFTKLKQAEEALQKHKKRLEGVVRKRTSELIRANRQLTGTLKRLESYTNAISYLNEMSEMLQTCRAENETYATVAGTCQRLFPSDSGFLSILEKTHRQVKVVASWGRAIQAGQEFGVSDCWAIRSGKLYCMVQPGIDLPCPHLREANGIVSLCAPISARGEVLGVLHMSLAEGDQTKSEADLSKELESRKLLLVGISERYAPCLTSLRLHETLRIQCIRDPLTGLYNRRYMEDSLEREERRAKRHGTQLGIIVLDVDHFKLFNDTYGHAAGDTLLRKLGSFLSEHTRGEDIACRYGGEEFTLILPEASLESTRQRAEELRRCVNERLRVRHQRKWCKITISAGVAVLPEHGTSASEVLESADLALYRAKAEGRDRVVAAAAVARRFGF